jgi:hypothetical protein
MKRLFLAMTTLALSACGPITPPATPSTTAPVVGVVSSVIAKADTVILTGERGFAVAELAYITAADGVGKLADHGAIRGATATRVRGWNAEAKGLLIAGKATADAAEKARAAARLFNIADALDALTGRK